MNSSPMICPWCARDVMPSDAIEGRWNGHMLACPYSGLEPDLAAAAVAQENGWLEASLLTLNPPPPLEEM